MAIGWTGGWKADFGNAAGRQVALDGGGHEGDAHGASSRARKCGRRAFVLLPWGQEAIWTDAQNTLAAKWSTRYFSPQSPWPRAALGRSTGGRVGRRADRRQDRDGELDWVKTKSRSISTASMPAGTATPSAARNRPDQSLVEQPRRLVSEPDLLSQRHRAARRRVQGQRPTASASGSNRRRRCRTRRSSMIIPTWFLKSDRPVNPGVMMANYGNPECAQGHHRTWSPHFIDDFGMTMYRQDFNIPPADYWGKNDTPDRIGMTEIGHIEGLYKFLDALLAKHPGAHHRQLRQRRTPHRHRDDVAQLRDVAQRSRRDRPAGRHEGMAQGLEPWNPQDSGLRHRSVAIHGIMHRPTTTCFRSTVCASVISQCLRFQRWGPADPA